MKKEERTNTIVVKPKQGIPVLILIDKVHYPKTEQNKKSGDSPLTHKQKKNDSLENK